MSSLVTPITESDKLRIHQRIRSLSRREREVMKQLIVGDTSADIAELLGITSRTVGVYRDNIISKMQARNTADAVRMVVSAECPELLDGDGDGEGDGEKGGTQGVQPSSLN